MKIIVDTPVWSFALRRKKTTGNSCISLLHDLIADGRVVLLGAVRQEILSGIRHTHQFEKLKDYLSAFPNLQLDREDYELAADYFNACRKKGIQGANTDFLICAIASRRNFEIFTSDKDFQRYRQCLPIVLVE